MCAFQRGRVPVNNADAVLRAGMSGRAKISRRLEDRDWLIVLLRSPRTPAWQTLWNWIGW